MPKAVYIKLILLAPDLCNNPMPAIQLTTKRFHLLMTTANTIGTQTLKKDTFLIEELGYRIQPIVPKGNMGRGLMQQGSCQS